MVGGGGDVYSKTVVGVALPAVASARGGCGGRLDEGALLIWDPHYSGHATATSDQLEVSRRELWDGGWLAWRPLSEALSAHSFYNVAMVRRAAGASAAAQQPEQQRQEDQQSPRRQLQAAEAPPSDAWASLIEVVDSS